MDVGSQLNRARWQYQPTLTDHADIINVLTINDPASVVVTPGTAALVITAFPPTVFASDNKVVVPGTATLVLTAFPPKRRVAFQSHITLPGQVTRERRHCRTTTRRSLRPIK